MTSFPIPASEVLALSSLGVGEPAPFARVLGTCADWQALGIELTGVRDPDGLVALYRGKPTARLWTLDREGDRWSGTIWGAMPVQGYGVVGDQPWYFRARHDEWSLSIARTLADDPVDAPHFRWSEELEGASYLEEDVAWACAGRALWTYCDPLVQMLDLDLGDPALAAACATTRCWHALASLAARAGGPVDAIRRCLWRFGIHPRMDADDRGRLDWGIPLSHTVEPAAYERALAEAGSHAALGQHICDALRAVWPRCPA